MSTVGAPFPRKPNLCRLSFLCKVKSERGKKFHQGRAIPHAVGHIDMGSSATKVFFRRHSPHGSNGFLWRDRGGGEVTSEKKRGRERDRPFPSLLSVLLTRKILRRSDRGLFLPFSLPPKTTLSSLLSSFFSIFSTDAASLSVAPIRRGETETEEEIDSDRHRVKRSFFPL